MRIAPSLFAERNLPSDLHQSQPDKNRNTLMILRNELNFVQLHDDLLMFLRRVEVLNLHPSNPFYLSMGFRSNWFSGPACRFVDIQ